MSEIILILLMFNAECSLDTLIYLIEVLEENAYSAGVGSLCLIIWLNFLPSWLIFCLVVLSVVERGLLKPLTIVVHLSIFPFSVIGFCFTDFTAVLFVYRDLGLLCLFGGLTLFSLCNVIQCHVISLALIIFCALKCF